MMVRTQITIETELQRRARQRASQMGVSLAEYVRRVLAQDLARPETKVDVSCVFDLGSSGGSNIAKNKDSMIAEAFETMRSRTRRSSSRSR
ncbi:MAG: hypothetical protein ABSE46_22740 [Terracidiphilus sp.]|jgi:hypothetical protein